MSEQMQDHIDRLENVDEMLDNLDKLLDDDQYISHNSLQQARWTLQETTAQVREDYGKMARARDAAVELLIEWCNTLPLPVTIRMMERRKAITQTIALLQGGEDDEAE